MFVAILAGPLQSASRVLMANLLDEEDLGKGFGLFTFSARSTFYWSFISRNINFLYFAKICSFSSSTIIFIGYFLFKNLELDTDINSIN